MAYEQAQQFLRDVTSDPALFSLLTESDKLQDLYDAAQARGYDFTYEEFQRVITELNSGIDGDPPEAF
jgi:predicted ribosomally synthesized peptide with nif11-like leader